MPFLGSSASVTRFNVTVPPEGPDFERARFWAIEPGSEVRERMGIVPFEPEADFEIAKGRHAFRVRIDRIRPDATSVKERLRELVKAEMEATGRPFVGSKTRRKLKELAEAELCMGAPPKTTIIEAVIDGGLLYVASTSNAHLGTVITLLRSAGVAADFKAPWLDAAPEADETSTIVAPRNPGESVIGCRFLKALLDDSEVMVEPEAGNVKLATREGKVTLTGAVLNDLHRYIEEGAEILSAKIHLGPYPLRFEALSYRLASLKLDPPRQEHWTMDIDHRLAQLAEVFEMLDSKYAAIAQKGGL
ncbi:MAG TPA: hypothetical protein VLT87_11205 [Thermoanaerobaculia bacterium]|nr:hypothetical protein [Thermoanaerobaculia bacterium]